MESQIQILISYEGKEIQYSKSQESYDELVQFLEENYPNLQKNKEKYQIIYKDSDGDNITISRDEDLVAMKDGLEDSQIYITITPDTDFEEEISPTGENMDKKFIESSLSKSGSILNDDKLSFQNSLQSSKDSKNKTSQLVSKTKSFVTENGNQEDEAIKANELSSDDHEEEQKQEDESTYELYQKIEKNQQQNQQYEQELIELQNKIKQYQEQIDSLMSENDQQKLRNEQYFKNINCLEQDKDKLTEVLCKLEHKTNQLQDELELKQAQKDEQQQKYDELNRQLAQQMNENEQIKKDFKSMKDNCMQLENQNAEMNKKLNELEQVQNFVKKEIEQNDLKSDEQTENMGLVQAIQLIISKAANKQEEQEEILALEQEILNIQEKMVEEKKKIQQFQSQIKQLEDERVEKEDYTEIQTRTIKVKEIRSIFKQLQDDFVDSMIAQDLDLNGYFDYVIDTLVTKLKNGTEKKQKSSSSSQIVFSVEKEVQAQENMQEQAQQCELIEEKEQTQYQLFQKADKAIGEMLDSTYFTNEVKNSGKQLSKSSQMLLESQFQRQKATEQKQMNNIDPIEEIDSRNMSIRESVNDKKDKQQKEEYEKKKFEEELKRQLEEVLDLENKHESSQDQSKLKNDVAKSQDDEEKEIQRNMEEMRKAQLELQKDEELAAKEEMMAQQEAELRQKLEEEKKQYEEQEQKRLIQEQEEMIKQELEKQRIQKEKDELFAKQLEQQEKEEEQEKNFKKKFSKKVLGNAEKLAEILGGDYKQFAQFAKDYDKSSVNDMIELVMQDQGIQKKYGINLQ